MIQQTVKPRSPSGWRGPALILAILLAFVLGSMGFDWLGRRFIGQLSSMLFIAYGCLIAGLLLRRYARGFLYSCDGSCLRVGRLYGRRQRHMLDAWLSTAKAFGEPGAMRQRFPGARVHRATVPSCPIAPMALVYEDDGRTVMLLLQPDDALRGALTRAVRG